MKRMAFVAVLALAACNRSPLVTAQEASRARNAVARYQSNGLDVAPLLVRFDCATTQAVIATSRWRGYSPAGRRALTFELAAACWTPERNQLQITVLDADGALLAYWDDRFARIDGVAFAYNPKGGAQ